MKIRSYLLVLAFIGIMTIQLSVDFKNLFSRNLMEKSYSGRYAVCVIKLMKI